MKNSHRKGSDLERRIAVQLSLWWTDNQRDDVFWRTSGSGARATTRGKGGKSTFNAAGDICFIDDIGKDLLRVFTFELKCGYKDANLQRFIDSSAHNIMLDWIAQAKRSAQAANSYFWAIISKQNRKETLIHFDNSFPAKINAPFTTVTYYDENSQAFETMKSMSLESWLKEPDTKTIINYYIRNIHNDERKAG
jgi:hypothetical protein